MKLLIIGGAKSAVTDELRAYYDEYIDFFKKSSRYSDDETIVESAMTDDFIISVGDGEFTIFDTRNGRDLADYDALFIRAAKSRDYIDLIATINEFARINRIPIINDYSGIRDSSKLLQAVQFHELDAPVARTVFVNNAVINNEQQVGWEFPSIMKAVHGSHGNDNYVVKNMDDVKNHVADQPDKRFVLQRFVPNDGDFRILIIGNEVLVIERKAVSGSHLNNTSQGGTAGSVDVSSLPAGMVEKAKDIMTYLNKTIGGVDVLIDRETKQFYFLEINSQPQLMTGAFVDEKEKMVGKLLAELSHKG